MRAQHVALVHELVEAGCTVSDLRVGRWKEELTAREKADFERVARPQLTAYGYLEEA